MTSATPAGTASPAEPRVLVDDLVLPEGPRWHDGCFWFVDMFGH
jgi:hypothetical protein